MKRKSTCDNRFTDCRTASTCYKHTYSECVLSIIDILATSYMRHNRESTLKDAENKTDVFVDSTCYPKGAERSDRAKHQRNVHHSFLTRGFVHMSVKQNTFKPVQELDRITVGSFESDTSPCSAKKPSHTTKPTCVSASLDASSIWLE